MASKQNFCQKCGRMLNISEFYMSKNKEKYPPDGRLNICKKCLTMHVDNWNPDTFLWILKDLDVPFIRDKWNDLLEKYGKDPRKMTGLSIMGRYLSTMKLKQWNQYHWDDTDKLEEESIQKKVLQMKAQGLDQEEIERQLAIDRTPPKPDIDLTETVEIPKSNNNEQSDINIGPEVVEDDELINSLTEEDKTMLRLKWGRSYRVDEWIRMEQLYNDMMSSYDIQGAGHKDTLIMICKASLKANQLIDGGDVEGFQKMSRVYDALMKSGKFTAAQIKEEEEGSLDSVGELVALCEKEGFIPRYYTDGPQDKVDRTLQDMQSYTRTLVTEELNLGNMLELAVKEIQSDKAREANLEADDNLTEDEKFEAELFSEEEKTETIEDYEEFEEFKESLRQLDSEDNK